MFKKLGKLLLRLTGFGLIAFVVSFVIYFFNLDMKVTSKLEPLVLGFYERRQRVQRI